MPVAIRESDDDETAAYTAEHVSYRRLQREGTHSAVYKDTGWQ